MSKKTEMNNARTIDTYVTDDLYEVLNTSSIPREIIKELGKMPVGEPESVSINKQNAGLLCDAYDSIQKLRISVGNQISAIKRGCDESTSATDSALLWYYSNLCSMEKSLTKAIGSFAKSSRVGRWMLDICGMGPINTVKLIAYFDITKCQHYNQFHSYAGLNDNNRPWLGKEKSTKIINEILNNRSEGLDLLKIMSKNFKDTNDFESYLDCIIDAVDQQYDDDHDKMELIRAVLKKKSKEEPEVLCKYVESIVESDGCPKEIDGVSIKQKKAQKVSFYQLSLVAEQTKWSVSYLNKTALDEKKGYITKEKLIAACSKIPYNKDLKKLCYIIGDCFVKQCNKPKSLYGRLYKERKAYEIAKNERGEYAEEAKRALASKNFTKDVKEVYESGKLPLGHIENRARRYAVKIFIAHLFEAMYFFEYDKKAPDPYPLSYLGHVDYIEPEVDFTQY